MAHPLMPKATAVWLVENSSLTFEQIAEFCGMHELEIQAVADGEVAAGIVGQDPIVNGQLTQAEIKRCEQDASAKLRLSASDIPRPQTRTRGARYTPVSKRQDRPDAIAWLLKHHPELSDFQIAKLIGTTKPTISAVRDRSHWNATNIKPRNPVTLGLCSEADLEKETALAPRPTPGDVPSGNVTISPEEAPSPSTYPVAERVPEFLRTVPKPPPDETR